MTTDLNRELAEALREHFERGWSGGVKRSWRAILLSRLNGALHGTEEELRHANLFLDNLFQNWICDADEELKVLVTGGNQEGLSRQRQALLMGHLTLAQGMIAQALRVRIDEPKLTAMRKFKKYLLALNDNELSNSDLAGFFGESAAHVTRQLSEMRKAGLVDFRKESKNTINFLTSASREMLLDLANDEEKIIY